MKTELQSVAIGSCGTETEPAESIDVIYEDIEFLATPQASDLELTAVRSDEVGLFDEFP